MFEFPAPHCLPVQNEAVAGVAAGRTAVQLLLGARYVILPMDDGTLVILRLEAAVWWDDQPATETCGILV